MMKEKKILRTPSASLVPLKQGDNNGDAETASSLKKEDNNKICLPKGFEEMVRGVIGDGEWDAFVEALSEELSVSVRINAQCIMHNWEPKVFEPLAIKLSIDC